MANHLHSRFHPPILEYDRESWEVKLSCSNAMSSLKIQSKANQKYARISMECECIDGSTKRTIFDETRKVFSILAIRIDAQIEFTKHTKEFLVIRIDNGFKIGKSKYFTPICTKTIEVEGRKIAVSKELLALNSPIHFEKLFYSDFKEATQDIIKFDHENAKDFRILNNSIEKWRFKPQNVRQACYLYDRSHFYQVENMKNKACECLLNANLSYKRKNINKVIVLADKFAHEEFGVKLLERAFSVFRSQDQVTQTMLDLKSQISKETIINILSSMSHLPKASRWVYLDFDTGRITIELDVENCPETCEYFMKIMKRELNEQEKREVELKSDDRRSSDSVFYHFLSSNHYFDFENSGDKMKKRDEGYEWGLGCGVVYQERMCLWLSHNSNLDRYFGRVVEGGETLGKDPMAFHVLKGYGVIE